jgi:hypothetical protein
VAALLVDRGRFDELNRKVFSHVAGFRGPQPAAIGSKTVAARPFPCRLGTKNRQLRAA